MAFSTFKNTFNTSIRVSTVGASYWDDTLLFKYNDNGTYSCLVILGHVADYPDQIPFTGNDLIEGADHPGCWDCFIADKKFFYQLSRHNYYNVWGWQGENGWQSFREKEVKTPKIIWMEKIILHDDTDRDWQLIPLRPGYNEPIRLITSGEKYKCLDRIESRKFMYLVRNAEDWPGVIDGKPCIIH